jgi:hypothetical protein
MILIILTIEIKHKITHKKKTIHPHPNSPAPWLQQLADGSAHDTLPCTRVFPEPLDGGHLIMSSRHGKPNAKCPTCSGGIVPGSVARL